MKKNEEDKQKEFIDSTLQKLKENITNFITKTNYSSIQSLYLLQQIDDYQKVNTELSQKKIIQQKNLSNENSSIKNEIILPLLLDAKNPKIPYKKESIYSSNISQKKKENTKKSEKISIKNINDIFNPSLSIQDSLLTEIKHLKNKEYLKYCNEYRNQRYFHPKYIDKEGNFIIKKEDMDQGILNMINKGLIPRSVDMTRAIGIGGSPLNVQKKIYQNRKMNRIYTKAEVATGNLNKGKYHKYDVDELYTNINNINNNYQKVKLEPIDKDWGIKSKRKVPFYHETLLDKKNNASNTSVHSAKTVNNINIENNNSNNYNNSSNINSNSNIINNNNLFITGGNTNLSEIQEVTDSNVINNISAIKYKNNSSIKLNNSVSTNYNSRSRQINNNASKQLNSYSKTIKIEDDTYKTFTEFISSFDMNNNIIISFESYKIVKDKNYDKFIHENTEKIFQIENIINNMCSLFKKLNIINTKIDSNKILCLLKYYNYHIENITNKDLLYCMTNEEIEINGFNAKDEQNLYQKIREAFIIRIQKMIRRKLAYNKYQFFKALNVNVTFLQSHYRRFIAQVKVKKNLEEEKNKIHNKFVELFNEFKSKWDNIQNKSRIEIHYFSISNDSYTNCLIDKFSLKEALQLNRLIRLVDPNLEIIYILPFHLNDEILTYYISLLENIGIKKIEDRLHFFVPEATEFFPCNYNLAKLIYFSPKLIKEIKTMIKYKEAYIIPGEISHLDERLCYLFDKPIMMGNISQIDLIFNKSGIKSVLELNEIPFPISAWDIKTEEEFYSSLAHLIVTYPTIQVWLFKCNLETNGKGIAYLNIGNIDIINELKLEQKNNPEFTNELYQEKLYYLLNNILNKNVKFSFPNLYTNWEQFLKKFLAQKGVIECCPTKNLDGIMNNPCLPLFIEPNGKIKILPSYDKINVGYFKNIATTSPQNSINNAELNKIGEQIGNFLYSQEIIGYVTLEFITFHDGKKVCYWGLDMKYGVTNQICDLQFSYILYIQSSIIKKNRNYFNYLLADEMKEESKVKNISSNSSNVNYINNEDYETNSYLSSSENCANIVDYKKYNYILSDVMAFNINYISTDLIKEIKLKDFLKEFRFSKLVFDKETKEGIIFNLCDTLESGIFGICGVLNLDVIEMNSPNLRLWKMIYKVIETMKDYIYKSQKKLMINKLNKGFLEKPRNDQIDFHDIINKVKSMLKEKELEKKKEDDKRKIIENTSFL